MNRHDIILAHQFFDFSLSRWEEFLVSNQSLESLFHSEFFSRRLLRCAFPKNLQEAKAQLTQYRSHYEHIVTYEEENYPEALAKLGNGRPPVLYSKGSAIPEENSLISIVGTRRPTAFGSTNAQVYAKYLSLRGFGIVSGLALGIDGIAHQEALPNYTLAVLGSGFDQIYPSEHEALAEKILKNGGTLLSQFPPLQVPLPTNFPRRNALIAALSAGVVVVEGSEKSGAIITGKLALEYGSTTITLLQDYRSPGGRGAIQLLEAGAIATRNIEESIAALSLRFGGSLMPKENSTKELTPLNKEFRFTEFQQSLGLNLPSALAILEGKVLTKEMEKLPNGFYRKKLT